MLSRRLAALAVALSFVSPAPMFAQQGKRAASRAALDAALRDPALAGRQPRVIVQYRHGAQANVRQQLACGVQRVQNSRNEPHSGPMVTTSVVEPAAEPLTVEPVTADTSVMQVPVATVETSANLTSELQTVSSESLPLLAATSTGTWRPAGAFPYSYDHPNLRRTLGVRSSDTAYGVGIAGTLLGIGIINLSLGHPICEPAGTDPLDRAVERASAAGIVVVTSAGNHGTSSTTGEIGYAGITSPGNAPSAITVGSLRTRATTTRFDDEVFAFSSRGPTWYDGHVKPDHIVWGDASATAAQD